MFEKLLQARAVAPLAPIHCPRVGDFFVNRSNAP